MKTIRLFVGICTLIATCACGNTKSESQYPTQATEVTNDAIKEEGTVFYDITLEEALEKAKAEKKYVLINFHTRTCAPCKKMEKTVFLTPQCGEYINKHFVPITIDGEDNGTGTEIAKKYNVFIFPTYLILSPESFKEGEILGSEFDIDKFLGMLKTIIHDV